MKKHGPQAKRIRKQPAKSQSRVTTLLLAGLILAILPAGAFLEYLLGTSFRNLLLSVLLVGLGAACLFTVRMCVRANTLKVRVIWLIAAILLGELALLNLAALLR